MAGPASASAAGKAKPGGKGGGDHFLRMESRVENMDYLIGQHVWIKVDSDELFALVTVKSYSADKVSVSYNGEQLTVPFEHCLNVDVMNAPLETHDLVKLPHANSAVVLDILRTRFMSNLIYTYAGKLLIVLNPFRLIPDLYGPNVIERYRKSDSAMGFPSDVPPHTYAVAQCAISGLLRNGQCQSCIVSGESGAGKTETAKQLMSFFAYGPSKSSDNVQQVVMGSNVILEAFGNAKTLRNNNSSRFGKFIKILVAPEGGLKGGIICSYMLELSRIEFQAEDERNYHIFYQCLKGLTVEEKQSYGFRPMESYRFLNGGKCCDAPGIDDVKEFAAVRRELQTLCPDSGFADFMRCIAGILLCGNIEFTEVAAMGVENAASVSNRDDFEQLCGLLGFGSEQAERALTTKVVKIQGNDIASAITVPAAEVNVRALAKDLYGALFEFCIDKINSIIQFDDSAQRWIGILDIYGFEYFQRNTYEQLLINYANERLQQYFINRVFASEIAEYDAEGINHSSISYTDNSEVLLVFDKPNCSIFSFLEEQCLIQTGSAERFTASCKSKIKSELFVPAQGAVCRFTVIHTATGVTYETDEFVAKNKHKLSPAILELLHNSSNSIVRESSARIPAETGNMKGKFLGSKFQSSIGALMRTLNETESHFIRCIKTNQQKQPLLFETRNVYGQLISLSIVEAIQTIHRGFAYRATFEKFIQDNEFLNSFLNFQSSGGSDMKSSIVTIMRNLGIDENEYQVGHTKVFLKKNGWMMLEKVFLQYSQASKPLTAALYSIMRVWRNRRHLERSRSAIIRIQSNMRRYVIQASSIAMRERANEFVGLVLALDFMLNEDPRVGAATTIQAWCRMFICRRRYLRQLEAKRAEQRRLRATANLRRVKTVVRVVGVCRFMVLACDERRFVRAATTIASFWRMHVAIRRLNNLRLRRLTEFAATMIQKHVRGYLCRKGYRHLLGLRVPATRIQSLFRMCLAINHLPRDVGLRCRQIRERLRAIQRLAVVQTLARSVVFHRQLLAAHDAVLSLQKFCWPRACNKDITRVQRAGATIKDHWRRYNQSSVVRVERNRLLDGASRQLLERLTTEETECAHRVLQRSAASRNRRLLPVHVNVYSDHRPAYPSGWSTCLEQLLCKGGSKPPGMTSVGMCLRHSVAVLDDREVYAFGGGSRLPRLLATVPPPLQVTSVKCGAEHAVLLLSDGTLYGWGGNANGQCGVAPSTAAIKSPTLIRMPFRDGQPIHVRSVGVGAYHNCAVGVNGEVLVWGSHVDLNLPSFNEDILTPAEVPAGEWLRGERAEEAHCGRRVSYLLTAGGQVLSFGRSTNGQLGHEFPERRSPRPVDLPDRVVSLSCGGNFTLAVTSKYEVFVFGTALCVRGGRELQHTFALPTPLAVDRAVLRSPVVRCSAGLWESNVLTEAGRLCAWSHLRLDDGRARPIIYVYSCASECALLDVQSAYCGSLSATLAVMQRPGP
ncbi:myosin B, putative [Babesia bigemina]|uniref:Myosin-A n=1 Tax=Babesia bigemina TaxID=5866 RepID=A0A061D3W5_BABBI|nr:myosin B, putative [Babesia bigemina]CDR94747.1 myosin B, putative [Babesia bigemina]|eukprot:XP_012766933.1 myosin B, putative [Babesia bigemina]